MSRLTRGLLLSALVMPGLGQIYFKRYLRGSLYMASIFSGMLFISLELLQATMNSLDQVAEITSENATGHAIILAERLMIRMSSETLTYCGWAMTAVYIIALIDTYVTAQKIESAHA